MNIHTIKTQSKELRDLLDEIWKKKPNTQIASLLGIHPPTLSDLYNHVLEKVISDEIVNEEQIKDLLKDYSSVSLRKFNNIPEYIRRLQVLKRIENRDSGENRVIARKITNNQSYASMWKTVISDMISNAAEKITKRGLLGLYNFYAHSTTFQRTIIKSPLLMRIGKDGLIEVLFRSENDPFYNRGTVFVVGTHQLTIAMVDDDLEETNFIHLSYPLKPNPTILRGVRITIDVAREPHASRIILQKIDDIIEESEFNLLSYEKLKYNELNISEISNYLNNPIDSTMKCFTLPDPTYTLSDLTKEKEMMKERFKDF